ncbi:hypothetical protein U1Q18_035596 [Sarracenia purpurea var. burkii]
MTRKISFFPTTTVQYHVAVTLSVQHHRPPPLHVAVASLHDAIAPPRAQFPAPPQHRPCASCPASPLCRRSLHAVSPIAHTPLSVAHHAHSVADRTLIAQRRPSRWWHSCRRFHIAPLASRSSSSTFTTPPITTG